MFKSQEWKDFFKLLGYKTPSRERLATDLLDWIYKNVKTAVWAVADSYKMIQIVSDGSSNVSKNRIENISFLANGVSYYWHSMALERMASITSEWTVDACVKAAGEITRQRLIRFNAFSSNTCNTQRKVWRLITKVPSLEHVLSIPCDSHSLQLVFKDILWPLKDAQNIQIHSDIADFIATGPKVIVKFFRKADKQLAILREKILLVSKEIRALISSVPTRWGTQLAMISSILRSSSALQAYAEEPLADCAAIQPLL